MICAGMQVNRVALGALLAAMIAIALAIVFVVALRPITGPASAGPAPVAAAPRTTATVRPLPSPTRPALVPAGPASTAPGPSPTAPGPPASRPTASPPVVPPPPAAATKPLATPAADGSAFVSGGIGLTRATWETLHGPGRDDGRGGVAYEQGTYTVQFLDDRVQHVERVWGEASALSIEEARAEARRLGPADARVAQPVSSRGGAARELFASDALKARFGAGAWAGAEAGQFVVLYRQNAGLGSVTSIVVATGAGP